MARNTIRKIWTKVMAALVIGGSMFAVPAGGCDGNVSGFPFSITPGQTGVSATGGQSTASEDSQWSELSNSPNHLRFLVLPRGGSL